MSAALCSAAMEVAGYEESGFLLSACLVTSEGSTGEAAGKRYPLVSLKTQQVVYTPSRGCGNVVTKHWGHGSPGTGRPKVSGLGL